MQPLVSVIVTCYNHDLYIEQCLESILNQDYPNIELHVWNDGSTDQSEKIIKEIVSQQPEDKVSYFFHENKGVIATRNLALKKITGEFVLFVDSDDFLEYHLISKMMDALEKHGADIAYCSLVEPNQGTEVVSAIPFDLKRFLVGNFISVTSLIRREKIGELEFDQKLSQLEDYDFFLALVAKQGARAVPVFDTHLNYRVHENSRSARGQQIPYYQSYLAILDKVKDIYPEEVAYALDIHFGHNMDLIYMGQKVTIYLDKGEGFSEEETLTYPLEQVATCSVPISRDVSQIRIDLSELPSFYHDIKLVDPLTNTQIEPVFHNGFSIKDSFFFTQPDPQLIYDVRHISGRQLILTYQLFQLSRPESPHYLPSFLVGSFSKTRKKLDSREREIRRLTIERDSLKQRVEDLVLSYNSVTHSRRWTIPTAIINFFRRNK